MRSRYSLRVERMTSRIDNNEKKFIYTYIVEVKSLLLYDILAESYITLILL